MLCEPQYVWQSGSLRDGDLATAFQQQHAAEPLTTWAGVVGVFQLVVVSGGGCGWWLGGGPRPHLCWGPRDGAWAGGWARQAVAAVGVPA